MSDREIGFLLRRRIETGGYQCIDATVITRERDSSTASGWSETPRGLFSWYDSDRPKHLEGLYLEGLGMFCHIYDPGLLGGEAPRPGETFPICGDRWSFRDVHTVDLRDAQGMVKTLDRLFKAMRKCEAIEAGDMLYAAAAALKATFVLEEYNENGRRQWRRHSVAYGRDRFRALIQATRKDVAAKYNRELVVAA